jgi:hypothetical protein
LSLSYSPSELHYCLVGPRNPDSRACSSLALSMLSECRTEKD